MTRHAVPNPVRLLYTDTCCVYPPPPQSADASQLLLNCWKSVSLWRRAPESYLEIVDDGGCVFFCRLNSITGNLSEERMTSMFKDGCRLLSCLLVLSGLASAWARRSVIGRPAGAVMGMTASLSQRTPGDTHLRCALSFHTVFTQDWERQMLQPV